MIHTYAGCICARVEYISYELSFIIAFLKSPLPIKAYKDHLYKTWSKLKQTGYVHRILAPYWPTGRTVQ